VDLDRASAEQLAGVPGIGPRTAEAIVEYRRAKGGIRNLRELLEVKGIGERKLERIAPWLGTSADGKPSLPGTDPSLPETKPLPGGTADGKAQGASTGDSKRAGSMAVETVAGTGGTFDVTP
jgi:competence ComEA-like helix-hairpin-helix protein